MQIQEKMSLYEKLKILSDAAKYDVACTSSGSDRRGKKKKNRKKNFVRLKNGQRFSKRESLTVLVSSLFACPYGLSYN